MRRREFMTGLVATAGWPFDVGAQQAPLRAGFLPLGSPSNTYDQSLVELFRQGLREVGVVENRDIVLDIVWLDDEAEIPRALTGLMERGAGLLIPCGTNAAVAAKRQVSTIPILFIDVFNPIGVGLVESFSRPGGNVTGLSDMHPDLSGKYVQFAAELNKPQATVNYLWFAASVNGQYRLRVTEDAAQSLRIDLRSWVVGDVSEIDDVLTELKASGATTVIVQSNPFTFRRRGPLIDAAMKHGIAMIYAFPPAATDGAVIAYGPDYGALYHRAAAYVKRILQGTKPADLPVEQPTRFDLVVNLKTARALGITIPVPLINLANQVIQ
jgi:putative tryptophan/tyrosine transport system substrate-binding protein